MSARLVALLLGGLTSPCPDSTEVRLGVGTQKLFTQVTKASVDDRSVVDVKVVPEGALVLGAKAGVTTVTMTVGDGGVRQYRVRVVKLDPSDYPRELVKAFPCGSTLEVRLKADVFFFTGEASGLAEWEAVFAAKKKNPLLNFEGAVLASEVIERTFGEANLALEQASTHARFVRHGQSVELVGASERSRALEQLWRPRLELAVKPAP